MQIFTTKATKGLVKRPNNLVNFSHYQWSPHLYLTQVHQLRLSSSKSHFHQASSLYLRLFRMLEEVIFDQEPAAISPLLEASTLFLTQLQQITLRGLDLNPNQVRSFQAKILQLEVQCLSPSSLKDLAVEQLSSLLGKCQGVVKAETEIQYIAFILDRFMKPDHDKQVATEEVFDGQIFFYQGHRYILPLEAVNRILMLKPDSFFSPCQAELYYRDHLSPLPLPVIDPNGRSLNASDRKKISLAIEVQRNNQLYLLPIEKLGAQLKDVSAVINRRAILHHQDIYFRVKFIVAKN